MINHPCYHFNFSSLEWSLAAFLPFKDHFNLLFCELLCLVLSSYCVEQLLSYLSISFTEFHKNHRFHEIVQLFWALEVINPTFYFTNEENDIWDIEVSIKSVREFLKVVWYSGKDQRRWSHTYLHSSYNTCSLWDWIFSSIKWVD